MTVTTAHLQGDPEPFSETIRALIARNWDESNAADTTPKFISDFGHGENPANMNEPLKPNDFNFKDDQSVITFREGDTTTVYDVRKLVYMETSQMRQIELKNPIIRKILQ